MESKSSTRLLYNTDNLDMSTISPLGYEMGELYEPGIDEWTVEKVLDIREIKIRKSRFVYENIIEYLILWKGYSIEEATWEPEEHLENCYEELENFKKKQLEKNRKTLVE